MDDLADTLELDPAISARLLCIVNSPLYGFLKQIDTITRAVNLIGMQAVSDLVAATTIGRTFSGMTSDLMDLPAYWRKSVLCALLAGKIAKACGIEDSERFFIEGLLRDIGHLVLYQTTPERAQSALVEAGNFGTALAEVEQSNIGFDFTEVGAELLRFWGMPSQIEQAIRHQLNPHEAGEYNLRASIIHLAGAGAVADHAELDLNRPKQPPVFDPFALSCTQFNPDKHPALLKEAQGQLQEPLSFIYPPARRRRVRSDCPLIRIPLFNAPSHTGHQRHPPPPHTRSAAWEARPQASMPRVDQSIRSLSPQKSLRAATTPLF